MGTSGSMDSRKPAVSGTFYPGNKEALLQMIESLKKRAHPLTRERVAGIIVPHAGYQYSGAIASSGFITLDRSKPDPAKHLFVIGPNHRGYPYESVIDGNQSWELPNGDISLDVSLIQALTKSGNLKINSMAHKIEHSVEVQIPLLLSYTEFRTIIPIIMGDQEPDSVNTLYDAIAPYADDSLFVASSDLTHYMPDAVARNIDSKIIDSILKLNIDDLYAIVHEGATPCGYGPIAFLMSLARNKGYRMELVDYGTSADSSGDKTSVVGYSSIVCYSQK